MEDPGSPCPDVAMEDLESASRQAAMDAPITASLGPMGPLLRQLHSRPKGVGDGKIQLLKDDLVGLCISLKELSETEGARLIRTKWWMKEVRELCYDTQDYLDEAFVKHSGAGARRSTRLSTSFRVGGKLEWRPQIGKKGQGRCGASRLQQISIKRRNLKGRPRKVATSFSELMARVEVLDDVRESFELGPEAIKPDYVQADISRLTPHRSLRRPTPMSIHSEAGGLNLVGVEEPVNKLVNLLAFEDDSQKQLKTVSIFGFAGVGKTTIAKTLYHNFRGKFQCRAFLWVPRTPDMMGILTSILSQIKAPQVRGCPDVQDLIDNIRKHLQGKRYFIVIDDLWTTPVWNIISRAFPNDDCCSRIVTTTETEDVSLACCSYDSTYIFQMSPLNDDQSRKLFFGRIFGSEDGCPPEFREVSYGIISKCGGSPLATVIIASMLAWEPNLVMEKWKHIHISLPSIMSKNPTSDGMKEVLNLIYNYLPPHLKTCLLHLGVYPEGYPIGKDDIVKKWVAEGFLGTMEEGQNTEKTAGAYFDELVSRGMIQALDTNYSGEVLFCTVHQMVLDFIKDKSMEENFAITMDYSQSTLALPDKVRRLSVQFGGAKRAEIPEGIIISQVRSLLFFGFFKCLPLILGYGLLRVLILHIWADEDNIIDLSRISELCRLTYLKIKCNITIKLPAKIRRIQDLETLEVDARLCAVPSDIVHLEKLLHLRLPSESYLPHGVGDMTSLRTLGYFDIVGNSEDNVMDLGKLTNLQDLQLTCSTVQAAENLEKNLQLLGSILEKLSILQSVTLVSAADSDVNTLQDDVCSACMHVSRGSLSSVFPASALLERIELMPQICVFPSLPKWFEQFSKLRTLKIAVRDLCREDIGILKALPALTALSLYVQTAPAEIIVFDKTGFLVLSYFKFCCNTPMLNFESDAMPNLVKLKLSFNAVSRVEKNVAAAISIEHLPGLKEVSTKIRGAGAISIEHLPGMDQISTEMRTEGTDPECAWTATIINHKNNPTINIQLVGCFFNGNPSIRAEEIAHKRGKTQDKGKVEDMKEKPIFKLLYKTSDFSSPSIFMFDLYLYRDKGRNYTTQPLSSSQLLIPGNHMAYSSNFIWKFVSLNPFCSNR
uniref:Uncharacterized protein n=2 Tax=Avena sativa TaxID=4498 RepID=A0ACD5Z4Q9_AVESA